VFTTGWRYRAEALNDENRAMDRPLEDVWKVRCFGCGALNALSVRTTHRHRGSR